MFHNDFFYSCICFNCRNTICNALAQENDNRDTEIGGDLELGGDTGMTESDLGGNDTGMTISDLDNDTRMTNGQLDNN